MKKLNELVHRFQRREIATMFYGEIFNIKRFISVANAGIIHLCCTWKKGEVSFSSTGPCWPTPIKYGNENY